MDKQYKIIRKLRKTGTSMGVNIPKEIKSRFNLDPSKLSDNDFEEVFSYLNEGFLCTLPCDLYIKAPA